MKNLLLLFCVFSFINLSFVSCGSDEDDETFITNDAQAKEMIRGKWTVNSTKMESNYSPFDQSMNQSLVQSLRENVITMVFDGEYVVTSTTPKKNQSIVIPNTIEKYYFENTKLYVEDVDIKMTLGYSYKISEKTLVMTEDFTRDFLVKKLESEGIINGIDYTEIINAIPKNFSGKLIYTLKK